MNAALVPLVGYILRKCKPDGTEPEFLLTVHPTYAAAFREAHAHIGQDAVVSLHTIGGLLPDE